MTAADAPTSELQAREELAALYRVVAHMRFTDHIDTHISARIPGTTDQFLINRWGVLFHEMQPHDLVKIDPQGQPLEQLPDGVLVNTAGFTIHSAVHMARHDLACVIHTHTADGIAVSAQAEGLLPISQHALRFYKRLGYHDYQGIALDLEERASMVADLGRHQAMILRNHGLLLAGRTIAEAWVNLHYLERACQIQVKALAGGQPIVRPSEAVCERTAQQYESDAALRYCQLHWQSAKRLLEPSQPSRTQSTL